MIYYLIRRERTLPPIYSPLTRLNIFQTPRRRASRMRNLIWYLLNPNLKERQEATWKVYLKTCKLINLKMSQKMWTNYHQHNPAENHTQELRIVSLARKVSLLTLVLMGKRMAAGRWWNTCAFWKPWKTMERIGKKLRTTLPLGPAHKLDHMLKSSSPTLLNRTWPWKNFWKKFLKMP